MFYSYTHMATVRVKGLIQLRGTPEDPDESRTLKQYAAIYGYLKACLDNV